MDDKASREVAAELARLLASPAGLDTVRLLQLTGLLHQPDVAAPAAAPESTPSGPRAIGAWAPQQVDGNLVFVKEPSLWSLDNWASLTPRLTVKQGELPRRVCLLGESTAAGMFYGPALTPAMILEQQLSTLRGAGQYEVIDLTRVSIDPRQLVEVAQTSLQLKPDVLVVFAGNNWIFGAHARLTMSMGAIQAGGLAWRDEGPAGMLRRAQAELKDVANQLLGALTQVARAGKVELVFVVPEANLVDFERRRPVGWLPGDGNARWHEAYNAGIAHRAAGNHEGAASAAQQMIDLDRGTCATSYRMLGLARLAQGRTAEARDALVREGDAGVWDTTYWTAPRTPTVVADAMVECARRNNFGCVDLREVFARESGSLPGRKLFVDYCHLTVAGMKAAMAATAGEVIRRLEPSAAGSDELSRAIAKLPDPEVPPHVDALAKFQATMFNSQTQPPDLIEYWCASAIDSWGDIQDVIEPYLLAAASSSEPLLSEAFQRAFTTSQQPYQLHFNLVLARWLPNTAIDVISNLLERSGRNTRRAIDTQLCAHRAVQRRPAGIDACQAFYIDRPSEVLSVRELLDVLTSSHVAIHRAPWSSSKFHFVSDRTSDVALELTARIPANAGARSGTVAVSVNGGPPQRFEVGSRWTKVAVRVPRDQQRHAINTVTIDWPALGHDGDAARRDIGHQLSAGIPAEPYPIFGELFSLLARPA